MLLLVQATLSLAARGEGPGQGFANLIAAMRSWSQMNLHLEIQYGRQLIAEGA